MFDEEEVVGDQAMPGDEPPTPSVEEADDFQGSDEEFLNAAKPQK